MEKFKTSNLKGLNLEEGTKILKKEGYIIDKHNAHLNHYHFLLKDNNDKIVDCITLDSFGAWKRDNENKNLMNDVNEVLGLSLFR